MIHPRWSLAACFDSDVDFDPPMLGDKEEYNGKVAKAKAVCRTCPIQIQCLAYAIERREVHCIYGGLTPKERHELVREARAS